MLPGQEVVDPRIRRYRTDYGKTYDIWKVQKYRWLQRLMPYSGGLKRNIVQCLDDYGIPLKLESYGCGYQRKRKSGRNYDWLRWMEERKPIPGTEEIY